MNTSKVVAVKTGMESGIWYTIGAVLEIDNAGIVVGRSHPTGWTDRELRQDGFRVDEIPNEGDRAPRGWDEWR